MTLGVYCHTVSPCRHESRESSVVKGNPRHIASQCLLYRLFPVATIKTKCHSVAPRKHDTLHNTHHNSLSATFGNYLEVCRTQIRQGGTYASSGIFRSPHFLMAIVTDVPRVLWTFNFVQIRYGLHSHYSTFPTTSVFSLFLGSQFL
jgi:hypothetical protein